MTLQSDIDAALPALRREAEGRMRETVTVGAFAEVTDPVSGDPVRTVTTARYVGVGRVRYGSRGVSNSDVTGQPLAVQEPYLSIPVGSARLVVGDEVLVTASDDVLLVGRSYRVQGAASAGQVTAYRYPLEELS